MKKSLICVFASIVGVLSLADWKPVAAVPATKVTICHRTHSVTNPYVRITVSQNSVGNGNGKHGGASHDQWSNVLFGSKPSPNVFNPAVTYSPAPEKKWGDIISFTDVNGDPLVGGAANVAGLNNFGIGAQIFLGVGDYAGLCRTMSARDFYDVEVNEGGENPDDVLDEMNNAESDEWEAAKTACGGSFAGCDPNTIGTPTPPGSVAKVTICHRTHSVTNPYVRITVAQSSVGSGPGKHGGASHDEYSVVLFPSGKPTPNVFNPAVTYSPAPEKKWGDIIAFTDVDGNPLQGTAAARAGLNNYGIGAQIYLGLGAYSGLCEARSARDFFDSEVNDGGQDPDDVRDEMQKSGANEWEGAKAACGGSFVGCPPATMGAPTPPPAPPASPPSLGKVTICHRTHSVTNPYVRITVSQRSLGNGNGKHGGSSHDQWSNVLFGSKPSPNVFNPAVTYSPAPEKKWGDIIASTDVNGNPLQGGAAAVAGLNNTGIGASIFNGTGSYAGLCGAKSARAFYDIEVNDGGKNPDDVLEEMDDSEADEWEDAKKSCGGSFKGCSPEKLGPEPERSGSARLSGTIWIDANRDGLKGPAERVLTNYPVVIIPGPGNTSGRSFTALTNNAGDYQVPDIPAGNWIVRPAALPSTDYQQVFDSDSGVGRADWSVNVAVPPKGEGVADFAAALSPAAAARGVTDSLGSGVSTQRLRGSIWVDANRDGVQDPQEKILPNYPLTVTPGPGNTSGKSFSISTDASGKYRLSDIPPGNWIVKPSSLPNPNYEQVFDSDSGTVGADWSVSVSVPASGEGIADFAAALSRLALDQGLVDVLGSNPVRPQLPVTGNDLMPLLWVGIGLVASGWALSRRRHRFDI